MVGKFDSIDYVIFQSQPWEVYNKAFLRQDIFGIKSFAETPKQTEPVRCVDYNTDSRELNEALAKDLARFKQPKNILVVRDLEDHTEELFQEDLRRLNHDKVNNYAFLHIVPSSITNTLVSQRSKFENVKQINPKTRDNIVQIRFGHDANERTHNMVELNEFLEFINKAFAQAPARAPIVEKLRARGGGQGTRGQGRPHVTYEQRLSYASKEPNVDIAARILNRAIGQEPGNKVAYLKLAELYFKNSRDKEAIASLERLVEAIPEDASILLDCARMAKIYSQNREAQEYIELAIELNENDFNAYLFRAKLGGSSGTVLQDLFYAAACNNLQAADCAELLQLIRDQIDVKPKEDQGVIDRRRVSDLHEDLALAYETSDFDDLIEVLESAEESDFAREKPAFWLDIMNHIVDYAIDSKKVDLFNTVAEYWGTYLGYYEG